MENFKIGDLVTLDDGENIVEVIETFILESGENKYPSITIKFSNRTYNHLSLHYRLATPKEIKINEIKDIFKL